MNNLTPKGMSKQAAYEAVERLKYGGVIDRIAELEAQLIVVRQERDEAVECLVDMVNQYLAHNGQLTHDFMSAGESTLEFLEKIGFVKQINPAFYEWVQERIQEWFDKKVEGC